MENVSLHTFCLTFNLNHSQEHNVRQSLYSLSNKHSIAVEPPVRKPIGKFLLYTYRFNVFNKRGVNITLTSFKEKKDGFEIKIRNTLYCRINPRLLLNEENPYIGIFYLSKLDVMFDELSNCLNDISPEIPDICNAVLNRLDYCKNVELVHAFYADLYVSLMRQAFTCEGQVDYK